jgi:hypothetical protein
MNLSPTKYSYSEFIELSIYADLKGTLKPNDRLLVTSEDEFSDIKEKLHESNILFIEKSKKEIWIVSELIQN